MKIAICIGGETRDWHEYPSKNLEYFIMQLESHGHEIEVYGHTWSHCVPPADDRVKFNNIIVEDQVIIDDWVKEDWIHRLTLTEELSDLLDYNPLDHHGFFYETAGLDVLSDEIITSILNSCRAGYGQHISGWKSFQMAPNDCDMYIRWRWDTVFTPLGEDSDRDHYPDEIDFYTPLISHVLSKFDQVTYSSVSDLHVVFNGNSHIYDTYLACIEDMFFGFDVIAKAKIDSIDIFDALDIRFGEDYSHHKAIAHTLWTWLMINNLGMQGACLLPGCVQPTPRLNRFAEEEDEEDGEMSPHIP